MRYLDGRQLLFISIHLEQSIGDDETLPTQVDAVVDLLRGDAAALDEVMTKMVNFGWSEEMRNSGELLRFFVRGADQRHRSVRRTGDGRVAGHYNLGMRGGDGVLQNAIVYEIRAISRQERHTERNRSLLTVEFAPRLFRPSVKSEEG